MCHRSVGLVQAAIEEAGISTATVVMRTDISHGIGVPRGAYVRFPLGNPLGEPHRADQQHLVLECLLELLETATEPDTIVELPFRWRRWDKWL